MLESLTDSYGQLMFGRRIRLRVMLWALERSEAFNQTEAARGIDYGSSGEVAKELERLVTLKMLRKFQRTGNVGPQNYVRIDSPGWAIVETVQLVLEGRARTPADAPKMVRSVGDRFDP